MKFNLALCISLVFCTIHGSFADDAIQGIKYQLVEIKSFVKSMIQDLDNNKTTLELHVPAHLSTIKNESMKAITEITEDELSRNQNMVTAGRNEGKDDVASCYVMVTPLLKDGSLYAKNYLEQLETRTTEAVEKILNKFDDSISDGYDLLDDIDDIIPVCLDSGDEEEQCLSENADSVYEQVVGYIDECISFINNTKSAVDHLLKNTKSISDEQIEGVKEGVLDTRADTEACLKENKKKE